MKGPASPFINNPQAAACTSPGPEAPGKPALGLVFSGGRAGRPRAGNRRLLPISISGRSVRVSGLRTSNPWIAVRNPRFREAEQRGAYRK